MTCNNCNFQNNGSVKFCGNCGSPLSNSTVVGQNHAQPVTKSPKATFSAGSSQNQQSVGQNQLAPKKNLFEKIYDMINKTLSTIERIFKMLDRFLKKK
jgi:hypothetical protein